MKTAKTLIGPLKTKETFYVSVDINAYKDACEIVAKKDLKLKQVVEEFVKRLAMYDPEALAFINYAIYKKSQGKVKSEYSFEFSKEIDVNALYDLIGSEKK